jgi:superfamily II DNA or RNA helicase
VNKVITTKELIDKNLLSKLDIKSLCLSYSKQERNEVKRKKYSEEIKWIVMNEKRNQFITKLATTLKGNTLLLFNYVGDHGKPLYENIQSNTDKKVYFIHGGTDVEQRENIRQILDSSEKNGILVASYGTCSTGINIRNIHNVIFASPSRSVIRVLQSIGRGLRKSSTKDSVKLYDISDDLCSGKYENHTYRHMQEREKIYINERFNVNKTVIDLSGGMNDV